MSRNLRVPFIIYWLLVKDFFYNIDVCDNSNNEPGHCLSNSECSKIGTNIGTCNGESSGLVCCKITFNYFNHTYLLEQIFVRKSQTDVVREMRILGSDGACGQSFLQYGNKSINLKMKEAVNFDPEIHVFETPDKIIWPIWASYSRESRDLKQQAFGTNHLYVVKLNKLVTDELDNKTHPVSQCASESDKEDKFYTFLNHYKTFAIRKLFTKRMQKLNTMNLTVEGSSFIESIESEKRSRRSVQVAMDKLEDLTCERKQLDDVLNVEDVKDNRDIQSELEISYTFFKQMDSCESNLTNYNDSIDSVINYVSKSEVVAKELMEDIDEESPSVEDEGINEESSSDEETGYKIQSDEPVSKEQFSDSSITSRVEEKGIDGLQKITLLHKKPIKGSSDYEFNRHLKSSVYDNIRSQQNVVIHDLRKPVEVEATHDMRNPVQLEATHDMRKPVQVDETHDMRIPVKVETTHNMQESVRKESSHDLRIAVENNVDHNMRKPVEIERESVQREGTHDMRKPVASDESHDLRWPVLEGENDLRNLHRESNAYGNVNVESEDSKRAQRKLDQSRYEIDENVNLTLQNSFSDCKVHISLFSKKLSNTKDPSVNNEKQKQLKGLWEDSFKVCGKYNVYTTKSSSSKIQENWPWMVSLHEKNSGAYKHKCSASLLNSLWVVTVAHCVDMKPKSDIILVLGNQNSKDGKENVIEREIDEMVIHPKFKRGWFENDLALLRMKTPVIFQTTILPICLPWNVQKLTRGIPVFLGRKLKDQRTADDLKDLTVQIMTNYECEILYSTDKNKEILKDTFLCASKDERNCDSESGSSLIALDSEEKWSLVGLVSWGSTCTNPEQPAVYIRISSYVQWIKDVIDCYEMLM